MARMLPPHLTEETQSAAERKLFTLLRDELNGDWTVLHSLGIAEHRRKPWAEVDFVLVGPLGVYCLEVKGGRVAREEGVWEFTDRHNNVSQKAEGPFEQVGAVAPQLHQYLRDSDRSLAGVLVGFGVVMPDIEFTAAGPDIEQTVLRDLRHVLEPLDDYLQRLHAHWSSRFGPRDLLDAAQRGRVVSLLRPDFDLRPSLQSRALDVNAELLSLTEEQYRTLDGLQDAAQVLVRGGAGTGKTLLAREEAVRQAATGKRVLLCCYNKSLAESLRGSLAGVEGLDVVHLHGLMADLVREAGMQERLSDIAGSRLFEVFYPKVAWEALVELNRQEMYDVLLVDEGQDLMLDDYVEFMDAILKGGFKDGTWRVFFDPRQNIYQSQNTRAWSALESGFPFRLSVNCRNTEPIAATAALLSGAPPDAVLRAAGPDVELIWYRDSAQMQRETGRLLGRLLGADGFRPDQVVVLTHRTLARSDVRGLLPGCAIPVGVPQRGGSAAIRHSTIAAFKGLEADVIVLAELEDLAFNADSLLNYVGASRARVYLALVMPEARRSEFEQLGERLGVALGRKS